MGTCAESALIKGIPCAEDRVAWVDSGATLVLLIAVAKLALHLYAARFYGWFGDELYFIACSDHLDWGHVD